MNFGENKLSEERSLKIIVTFPNESIELLFTQYSASSLINPSDLKGWLELPAFDADQQQYYFCIALTNKASSRKLQSLSQTTRVTSYTLTNM